MRPCTAYRAPSQTTTTTKTPGQEDLERVQHGLDARHLDAGPAGVLRLAAVAVVEDLLAADAAQHPEPADDVGGGVGQLAHQVALVGAAAPAAA